MSGNSNRGSLRPVGLVGLAWGSGLLLRGPALFTAVQGRPPSSGERDAIVVLGVRHAGEGLLQVLLPDHLGGLYAGVDAVHAASMLVMAALRPERRRAVLVSAGAAVLAGVASARAARG